MNRVLDPGWSAALDDMVRSTRRELLVVAPYYSADVIRRILLCNRNTVKRFLLALNDYEAAASYQSISALQALIRSKGTIVRTIENLHAKVIISDRRRAIVTSSNLTTTGLEDNIEYGLEVDEPKMMHDLVDSLEYYWKLGKNLTADELKRFQRQLPSFRPPRRKAKSYGPRVSISKPVPKWILVHSLEYVNPDYPHPKDELQDLAQQLPADWHWRRAWPIREGGPYTILFAYDWKIFARGTCMVTHDIRYQRDLGGGCLLDVGSYCVNIMRLIIHEDSVEVHVMARLHKTKGVDVAFAGLIRFKGDSSGLFDCGFESPYRHHLEVVGDEGTLEVPSPFNPRSPATMFLHKGVTKEIPSKAGNMYKLMVEHFSDCVLEDRVLAYSPDESLRNMQLIDELVNSSGRNTTT